MTPFTNRYYAALLIVGWTHIEHFQYLTDCLLSKHDGDRAVCKRDRGYIKLKILTFVSIVRKFEYFTCTCWNRRSASSGRFASSQFNYRFGTICLTHQQQHSSFGPETINLWFTMPRWQGQWWARHILTKTHACWNRLVLQFQFEEHCHVLADRTWRNE